MKTYNVHVLRDGNSFIVGQVREQTVLGARDEAWRVFGAGFDPKILPDDLFFVREL